METLAVTRIVVIAVTIGLLIYDAIVYFIYKKYKGANGTISMYIWRIHDRNPLIILFAGMLIGHFFFPAYDVEFICE